VYALTILLVSLFAQGAQTDGIVSVASRDSFGHACPISASDALTAEHVSSLRHVIRPLVWSDGESSGTVLEAWADRRRDLSAVKTDNDHPFRRWFQVARAAPTPGAWVLILGYDFDKGLRPKPVRTRVLEIVAGHISYDKGAGPGSSGSCVLLEETGELVAINVGQFEIATDRTRGIGVAVWGDWLQIPTEYIEKVEEP